MFFRSFRGSIYSGFFHCRRHGNIYPKVYNYQVFICRCKTNNFISSFIGVWGILSVCACGILPLFQTIFQRGAGVGPAITFLFSGPAINIIAIVFTYQLLGTELGNARIVFVLILALSLGLGFAIIMGEPARRVNSAQLALIPGSKSPIIYPNGCCFYY